jgi:mRNA interferase MazF
MSLEGRVVLLRFPRTDRSHGKLRPAVVIRKVPGRYEDWLICMVSSNLGQALPDFDEVLLEDAEDFQSSGLKRSSVIRISRLAVVEKSQLMGTIGQIPTYRLQRVRRRLTDWLKD